MRVSSTQADSGRQPLERQGATPRPNAPPPPDHTPRRNAAPPKAGPARQPPASSPPGAGGFSSASKERASRLPADTSWSRAAARSPAAGLLLTLLGPLCVLAPMLLLPVAAEAQTTVWSGTLTVRDSSGLLGCSNGFGGSHCSVYLSPDEFTHDSTTYAIKTLWVRTTGRLELYFVQDLTTATHALTLNLDGTAFAFEDADGAATTGAYWNNSGLSWTVGDTVSATLTFTALVSNTEQGNAGSRSIGTLDYAQAFGTGSNTAGYDLDSIVLSLGLAPTGTGTLTVTVRADASGDPSGTALHTLTTPDPIAENALNTFTAPAGATLDANTTYWVVASYSADTGGPNWWRTLLSNGIDSGGAAGWTIDSPYKQDSRTAPDGWGVGASARALKLHVKGAAKDRITVPSNWSLKPSGLSAGDEFRLLFLTSTNRNAQSAAIADYNTFVQNRAAAGHTDIQSYSSGFTAVASTDAVNARDNTSTTGTGFPIYSLGGAKQADDYADFYDGSWDREANLKDESGNAHSATYVWTGSNHDGTKQGQHGLGPPNPTATVGRPNATGSLNGPMSSNTNAARSTSYPLYGLSPVFVVGDDPVGPSTDATLSALALSGVTLDPTFVSTTETYTATVVNSVTETTVTATPTHSGATVAFKDGDDNALTDPVTLAVGDNVIKAVVTAEDTTTIKTYMVTVTRAGTATTVPGAPTGLTATASGTSTIDLAWTAPSNDGGSAISGYRIEVSSDGGSSWISLVVDTDDTNTTYEDQFPAGTTRHYRVSAINSVGTGAASNVATLTVPGAPTGLMATASGTNTINLTWTAPSNDGGSAISGYRIDISSDGGSSWITLVVDTDDTSTTYEDRQPAGTTRHYRVSAINSVGTGAASNVDAATTAADNTCLAPNLAGRMQIWTGTVTVEALQIWGDPVAYGFGSRVLGHWTIPNSVSARTTTPWTSRPWMGARRLPQDVFCSA